MPTTQESSALLEPLPAPARLALERIAGDGGIGKLSTDEYEGREVYTAVYVNTAGDVGHAQVSGDGRVLSNYTETMMVPVEEAPEVVRESIVSHTGGSAIKTVEVEHHGERDDRYVVNANLQGTKHRYTFNETGSLLSEATEIHANQIPAAASASLGVRFPGLQSPKSKVWEVRDRVGAVSYTVEGWTITETSKTKVRVQVKTTGQITSVMYLKD